MPISTLLNLDDAKANLNNSSSVNDAELLDVIDEASDIIEDLTGPVRAKTVTDVFRNVTGSAPAYGAAPGFLGGKATLLLSEVPVLSVTSVTVAWQGSTTATYTQADLNLNATTGEVSLASGSLWTQDVTVVYVAGRASVPACVRRAMQEQVRHIWETQRATSTARPSYDTEQFTATPSGYLVPNRVAEAVAPVRRAPRVG